MKQIKIFKQASNSKLESEVNKWLQEQGDSINIIDTKYQYNDVTVSGWLFIITYEIINKSANTTEVSSGEDTLDKVKRLIDRYYVAGKGIVGDSKISMRSHYWCELLNMLGDSSYES